VTLDLAFRQKAHQTVNGFGRATEMLFQWRAFGGERAEHKAAIGLHPRHPAERQLWTCPGPS